MLFFGAPINLGYDLGRSDPLPQSPVLDPPWTQVDEGVSSSALVSFLSDIQTQAVHIPGKHKMVRKQDVKKSGDDFIQIIMVMSGVARIHTDICSDHSHSVISWEARAILGYIHG